MGFTHLHVHTEYSLLDGAARIKDVVKRAKELGMESLAITDHGAMFGVIDFYDACLESGIRPIIGCEVYTASRSMLDKEPDKDKRQGHLVLLAENNEGYQNLIKIVSEAYTKGFYYKPRVDKELLRKYSGGIIALSACLAGDVQRALLHRDYNGAKREAREFLDIFGKNNFFLEVQNQGLEEETMILPDMKRLSEELDIPLVATNDVHYVRKEDAKAHDVLLCIQTLSTVDDENRMRFPNQEFYLKSEKEMRVLFSNVPGACDMTQEIARRCNVTFDFNTLHLPEFEVPDGYSAREYLRMLCEKGLVERYGDAAEHYRERLSYELGVIEQMGYVEYFLIVWDFINYARTQGIQVGPGRGSAAGSIVAYVLNITDTDPIKYSLIFERFLNPERVSMPDIDIDFCYERRHEVIEYVNRRYGEDRVSQIITFGTMKAKAAVRDVGRALGARYDEIDAIAKAIPNDPKITIRKALDMNPDLKKMAEENGKVDEILQMAQALEGMPRHASTHAAGVVISRKATNEYVPLYYSDKGAATQFTMTTIERMGLLKMDFLGLRNLTVIRDALAMIKERHGVEIDFHRMDYDDPAVFQTIASGNTQGIFQLESSGMTSFMKNLKPDCFEDIVAGIALYRPGPMASIPTYIENKKNPEAITYLDQMLKPILSVTYGCMVYQEQVMQIVRDLAGYSYGRSDLVRRAMSKKKMDKMLEEKEYFIHGKDQEDGTIEILGCVRNGISEAVAEEIYSQMIAFAEYAFNKSHAAAYAVVGYETAYLKTYYTVEFMAALMTSVIGESGHIATYMRNCVEMGIDVLPPSINESGAGFTVIDGRIRFGLSAVLNVGKGAVNEIVRAREAHGVPSTIFEFIEHLNIREVNKKAMESLIKAGALDCLEGNRAQHLAVYEKLMESAQSSARKNIEGQMSLFAMEELSIDKSSIDGTLPEIEEFPLKILAQMEKQMMGIYLTWNPLDEYKELIDRNITMMSSQLIAEEDGSMLEDGQEVLMAGMVSAKRVIMTRTDKQMAFVTVEDLDGPFEMVVFPGIYEKAAHLLAEDTPVAIRGKLSFKEDEAPSVLADSIVSIDELSRLDMLIKIRIPEELDNGLIRVQEILERHKGSIPVKIYINGKAYKVKDDMRPDGSEAFRNEMMALVGRANYKEDEGGGKH